MGHYDDYEMHKWDDYTSPPKLTDREKYIKNVANDIFRARSLIRQSLDIVPIEVFDANMRELYGALEIALTEEYNKWKNKKV